MNYVGRVVGHFDLDYFYAQVEEVENPTLAERPVLVCVYSGRTEESGVVSTANYKARELGVKSGIPIAVARRRLQGTGATFLPVKREKYEAYSGRIMESIRAHVDIMEQTGIDEAFFDVTRKTNGDFGVATALGVRLKQEIRDAEGLTCSIGIAHNKAVAKVASNHRKPDGLTVVRPEEARSFLAPLPVGNLQGVGLKTIKVLEEEGIHTVGQLAVANLESLRKSFGIRMAAYLQEAASGENDDPVAERDETTQISRIITLRADSNDGDKIFEQLSPLLASICDSMTEKRLSFKTVSVIGVLSDLSVRTRSKTLGRRTTETRVLARVSRGLLVSLVEEVGLLRRAGLRISDFGEATSQTSLSDFAGG